MAALVEIDYECCGATYKIPTSIPDNGSALRHASAVDTVTFLADLAHHVEHPDCPSEIQIMVCP